MVINTTSLNSNFVNLKNDNCTEQVTQIPVTIVGYSRYGNQLLGPKYAEPDSPWEVKAIIDPQINLSQFQNSILGKKQPNTLLFRCFSDWFKDYFSQITDGVHIFSESDMKPPFQIKRKYPDWDVQERSLKLYFSDSTTIASLEVDFWIKFDCSGAFALRPGQIIIRDGETSGDYQLLKLNFVEDQLRNMNYKIYKAFEQDFFSFQSDASVLSLERYKTIGQQIMNIQQKWSQLSTIKYGNPI